MSRRERIEAYVKLHPKATVRAIQKACNISSTSVVTYHLKRLDTPRTICCPTCAGAGRVKPSSVPDGFIHPNLKNLRIAALEAALRDMTSNRIHDALCQCFEDWENEHAAYDRAVSCLMNLNQHAQHSPKGVTP